MKELDFLHYQPGNSFWHRHDARAKILELAVWTALIMLGRPLLLGLIGVELIVIYAVSGISWRRLKRPLIFWLVMAIAIVGSSAGHKSALAGLILAIRLLLVLTAGHLLTATTDPAAIAFALKKLTFFLPPAWSASLASAISLTLAMLPRLMDGAATVRDAALSRGLNSRRSVFRRFLTLGLPLSEAALHQADICAEALITRCYSGNPTYSIQRFHRKDGLVLTVTLLPLITCFVLLNCL